MKRLSFTSALIAIISLTQFGSRLGIAETTPPVYATAAITIYEISNLKDEDVIRVDLVFEPNVKAIVPTLRDVAFGERHDASLHELFKLEMEEVAPEAKVSPALLIKVKPKSLRQGSYKLRIEFLPVAPAAATTSPDPSKTKKTTRAKPAVDTASTKGPQSLTLELKLPATDLKLTEKLVIDQVRNEIFAGEIPSLKLTVFSDKDVRLTDVRINHVDPSGKENVADSRKVNFATVPEIAPNGTSRSAITLEGVFPIGSSSGAALISAPQLAKPVWVPFEVKARRAKWIILAVMVLGLILGFITRIWTKQRIELQEAQLKGLEAYQTLDREQKTRPDKEFHRQIDPSLKSLETAIESGNVELIKTGITTANTELTAALKDLDLRRATAKSQLEKLSWLAKTRASLPAAIAAALLIDDAALEKAQEQLKLDDVAGAHQTLTPLVTGLGGKLGSASLTWRGHVKSLLDQLAGISKFLPESVAASLTISISTLTTALDGLVLTTEESGLDEVSTLVSELRYQKNVVNEFVNRAGTQLSNSHDSMKAQFETVAIPEPELVNAAFRQMGEMIDKFSGWAERPETGAKDLQQAIDRLRLLWPEAMLDQITHTDPKVVKEAKDRIQALLQQGKYQDAAIEVIAFLRANPLEKLLGETGGSAATDEAAAFAFKTVSFLDFLSTGGSPSSQTMISTVREQTLPPNLSALSTKTWRELAAAKALRFAIASVIILAIGYALFAETFVGTFNELLSVFVWAFGLNLSADTVMDSVKTVKIGS